MYGTFYEVSFSSIFIHGGLAQLARAPALQAGGQRFESVILHFYGNEIKTVSRDVRKDTTRSFLVCELPKDL